jgi:hypothetical protein
MPAHGHLSDEYPQIFGGNNSDPGRLDELARTTDDR